MTKQDMFDMLNRRKLNGLNEEDWLVMPDTWEPIGASHIVERLVVNWRKEKEKWYLKQAAVRKQYRKTSQWKLELGDPKNKPSLLQ